MENFDTIIRKIWEKAKICSEETKDEWRRDSYNGWIRWKDYGNIHSDFGWVIDIISPQSGGEISNLRPMQWKNEFKVLLQKYLSRKKNAIKVNTEIFAKQNYSPIMEKTLMAAAAIVSGFSAKG